MGIRLVIQTVYSNFELWTLPQEGASQLQSRKFLPLMYQLAARMSARTLATDLFQQTLQQVCVYIYACLRAIERGEKGEGGRGVLVCACDMIHVGVRIFASCWKYS